MGILTGLNRRKGDELPPMDLAVYAKSSSSAATLRMCKCCGDDADSPTLLFSADVLNLIPLKHTGWSPR